MAGYRRTSFSSHVLYQAKWSDFQRNRSMSRIFWRGNATSELCATTTMTNVAKLDQNNIIAEI